MSITIRDEELKPLLRVITSTSEPEPHLRYRLRQRIEARLHELDPGYSGPLGPAWVVWVADPLNDAIAGQVELWSDWSVHEEFSYLDDADGARAQAAAHQAARILRTIYHCSFFAVTPAEREPLPLRMAPPSVDEDFKDFSASWLGL
jgi:hypothetical protein